VTRRIVCWLTQDPASLAATKLAIRENRCEADPLPLVVVVDKRIDTAYLEAALGWLDMPAVAASPCKAELYRLHGDVHVIGVPVEEQGRYDAFMAAHDGVPVLSVLADRGLTRTDCEVFVSRAGFVVTPSQAVAQPMQEAA